MNTKTYKSQPKHYIFIKIKIEILIEEKNQWSYEDSVYFRHFTFAHMCNLKNTK